MRAGMDQSPAVPERSVEVGHDEVDPRRNGPLERGSRVSVIESTCEPVMPPSLPR